MEECFPRSNKVPNQSPLFWVTHKDRYLRQLLIRDIAEETGRDLIVYFTDCDRSNAQIDSGDDPFLVEMLLGCKRGKVDLLLETNGGMTDATEKICSILRSLSPDLRVIVPRRAKSNGTVIALCGNEVLLGPTSELGPIDPSFNGIPVEFVLAAPAGAFNPLDVQFAKTARAQTRKLARDLLASGMMHGRQKEDIDAVVTKLDSRDHYHSHGSVVDAREAKNLGLVVREFSMDDEFWKKIWLLRAMYAHDCGVAGYAKVFEGERVSNATRVKVG